MSGNVTLRSNVYINVSARNDDKAFVQHITDYRVLKKLRGGPYDYSPFTQLMTSGQLEILRQGQPNCSLEKGTMSWGIPVGSRHMVCRCEQRDCPRFALCSKYANFQAIQRDTAETDQIAVSEATISPLPLFHELVEHENQNATEAGAIEAGIKGENTPEELVTEATVPQLEAKAEVERNPGQSSTTLHADQLTVQHPRETQAKVNAAAEPIPERPAIRVAEQGAQTKKLAVPVGWPPAREAGW